MDFLKEHAWAFYIIKGVEVTLEYSVLSVIFGLVIGAVIALFRMSSYIPLKLFATFYISVIRGTPLLLQLSIVYFAIPGILGYRVSPFLAGIIAFSINSSAYIAEIVRAGILAVDKGQFEAAAVLKIPYLDMMKDIILPQAFRNMLPALVNECSTLIKESSLIAIIGEADLMRRAQIIAAEQYTYFEPLLVAGACYYILVLILNHFANRLEGSLNARYK
jgi:His/Glu/Gln/Arg/opine family amino acid ABC transporter permease subunit